MKGALKFAVLGEVLTGLALLIVPVLVGQLLLGVELTGAAIPPARVAGIALIGLSVACLPGRALLGMLIYGALVMLYLGYLGCVGGFTVFCFGQQSSGTPFLRCCWRCPCSSHKRIDQPNKFAVAKPLQRCPGPPNPLNSLKTAVVCGPGIAQLVQTADSVISRSIM
jgi:hypothetical protein